MLSSEIRKVSSKMAWMERLALRKAKKQAALQAIRRTWQNPNGEVSYATVVARRPTLTPTTALPNKTTTTSSSHLNVFTPHPLKQSKPLQPQPLNRTTEELTEQSKEEEGWIVVTKRRRIQKTKAPFENRAPISAINKRYADLVTQGRCFKCLEIGHKRSTCMARRRCFICHNTEHTYRHCGAPPTKQGIKATGQKKAPHRRTQDDRRDGKRRPPFQQWIRKEAQLEDLVAEQTGEALKKFGEGQNMGEHLVIPNRRRPLDIWVQKINEMEIKGLNKLEKK